MTCVVGYADGGKVWIGADSLSGAEDGWHVEIRRTPKVFGVRLGGGAPGGETLVVGFTSSWRMGQILQTAEEVAMLALPDARGGDWTLWRWMVTAFAESARAALKRGGYVQVKDAREDAGEFLAGVRGRLFYVGSDFQVVEPLRQYAAVGAGARVALGALYGIDEAHARAGVGPMPPEARVRMALEAAQEFNGGVRGPFTILSA